MDYITNRVEKAYSKDNSLSRERIARDIFLNGIDSQLAFNVRLKCIPNLKQMSPSKLACITDMIESANQLGKEDSKATAQPSRTFFRENLVCYPEFEPWS